MSEKEQLKSLIQKINPNATFAHVQVIEQMDNQDTCRFVWHPWGPQAINNLGAEGPKCGILDVKIPRLTLIPITARRHNEIVMRRSGDEATSSPFATITANETGRDQTGEKSYDSQAVPGSGSPANTRPVVYYPYRVVNELITAYGQYGLAELRSLAAQSLPDRLRSELIYKSLFEANSAKFGKPVTELLLEEFPSWLYDEAPETLKALSKKPIVIDKENKWTPDEKFLPVGNGMILEIAESIKQVHTLVLNTLDGILPTTRKGLNAFQNGGVDGKANLDTLDIWLLEQFPSFQMDSEVERQSRALQAALTGKPNPTDNTEFIKEQNKIIAEQSKQINELIGLLKPTAKEVAPVAT